jgi:pSer/pThr/pTyr-binding forkhead associated (FHA) protein
MQKLYLEATGATGEQMLEKCIALNRFPAVVGRHSECDYCLSYPFVSRRHCEFFERDGKIWAQDLNSQNGTRLNGQPLSFAMPLLDGDRLDLAFLSFRVRLGDSEPTGDAITVLQPLKEVLPAQPAPGAERAR